MKLAGEFQIYVQGQCTVMLLFTARVELVCSRHFHATLYVSCKCVLHLSGYVTYPALLRPWSTVDVSHVMPLVLHFHVVV